MVLAGLGAGGSWQENIAPADQAHVGVKVTQIYIYIYYIYIHLLLPIYTLWISAVKPVSDSDCWKMLEAMILHST